MDRIHFASKLIKNLGVNTLLDVGCRDAILKKSIPGHIEYVGFDIFQNENNSVDIVGDICVVDLPANKFEVVVALDILEHLDNPYDVFRKLLKTSSKFLIVNLPNCYDLKSQYKFTVKGQLGGKYRFDLKNSLDRHRWLMNINEIENFYKHNASEENLTLEIFYLKYGGGSRNPFKFIMGTLLRIILPNRLSTNSVVAVFEKK
jgi:hypothetical protein